MKEYELASKEVKNILSLPYTSVGRVNYNSYNLIQLRYDQFLNRNYSSSDSNKRSISYSQNEEDKIQKE